MDTLSTGHQEQMSSGSTSQSEWDHIIVSDIVVSKIAGLAVEEIEGVQVSNRSSQALGDRFLDSVSPNGHPRSVLAIEEEEGVTINLTIDVQYGKAIPQITEAVRSSVIRRVENEVGHKVNSINITVNDVLLPEVMRYAGQAEKRGAKEETERPEKTTSIDGPASSMPSTALPGEAYFDLWSRSLQQYRHITDAYFRPYTDGPRQTDGKKD